MKSKTILLVCLATLFAGMTATRSAAALTVGAKDNVQIGGFFSQGWLQSSGNNYPFEAKDGTFDFREMAVNVSTTVGSHLRLGAQGFAQRLGNYGNDKVMLDWAVADYNFRPEFGIRAGRIKYPKGLYGEALDLDVVRPFVFLPMSVYNPIMRDYNSSFDGGMLYGSLSLGRAGSLDYKAFYGDIPMGIDQGVADYFNSAGVFNAAGVQTLQLDAVGGFSLDWNTPVSGLKAHLSWSRMTELDSTGQFGAVPFPLTLNLSLPEMNYSTVGLEYVRNDWTFAAEFQQTDGTTLLNAAPIVVNNRGNYGINNWYVSAARRFAGRFEAGAYYSVATNRFPSSNDRRADKELHDYALSVRCDVNEHVTVKLEGHYIDGSYNVFNTARTPNPVMKDTSSFFAAKTTFSF
ncbi:hypothetical protein ESB00_14840 [Oleiharenicola lentus]|jgi:hypothetical protein|uniref:Porin n=1 Tax=Oleiharenicola lentus TaxID=2508720 RepID=A0A4Q1C3Q6_9BACT|nr:hypothetical protein [Oleiharenicola lentus]RXK52987.1 hypothetical protein ESB00_14840 [Oleiharenicola lentus]